jgi:hypothetical protein
VVPSKQVVPLEQIDLPITFDDHSNFWTETLTFEVVDFVGSCYAKFMVVQNYTYLKLNMLGPYGVITMGTTFQHAY